MIKLSFKKSSIKQEFLNNIFSFSNKASGIQKISNQSMVNTNSMIKVTRPSFFWGGTILL